MVRSSLIFCYLLFLRSWRIVSLNDLHHNKHSSEETCSHFVVPTQIRKCFKTKSISFGEILPTTNFSMWLKRHYHYIFFLLLELPLNLDDCISLSLQSVLLFSWFWNIFKPQNTTKKVVDSIVSVSLLKSSRKHEMANGQSVYKIPKSSGNWNWNKTRSTWWSIIPSHWNNF